MTDKAAEPPSVRGPSRPPEGAAPSIGRHGHRPPDRAVVRASGGRPRRRPARARGVRGSPRADVRRHPRRPASQAARRARPCRNRAPLRASGPGAGERVGRHHDRHDGDRVGQVALLPAADPGDPARRPARARHLPLSDEGARPGPGPRAAPLRAPQGAAPGDLRRRHAARGTHADSPPLEPDPHQPGHAPRRRAPPPRALGRPLREPRDRRRGRGARVPRRVRQPCRQRPAAAAPRGRRVRDDAAHPARERDDREPGRARRAADRPGRRAAGRRGRLAGRAPADRDVEPAARGRDSPDAAQRPLRGGRAARAARARGLADDLLHEVAQGRRARREARLGRAREDRATASSRTGSRPTARATRRSSGASSSGASPKASCSRS